MKTRFSLGLLSSLSLVLAACSGDDDDLPVTAAPGDAPPDGSAADIDVPEPSWRPCGQFDNRDLECAEVLVPIDYTAPDGEKLAVAMRRIVADPLEPYHGALLINPGGPGGEGIDFALSQLQNGQLGQIAPGFDIVGFDPRGVGASGERGCGTPPDETYPDSSAGTASGAEEFMAQVSLLGPLCEAEWGPLFRHLGSKNVVRDMEEIRKALRQPVLNFYGGSYGTRLGALYAHEFPETTGRIVLDGPVPPRVNFIEELRGQFYRTLFVHEQVLSFCETGVLPCPLEARALFDRMVANATARGLLEGFASFWRDALGTDAGLGVLLSLFDQELADPGGDWLESYLVGDESGGTPSIVAFASVTCTDDTIEPPTFDQVQSIVAEFNAASPLFADTSDLAGLCAAWPATRDPVELPTAPDVREPLLVIGGVLDWRTPYPAAQEMAEALGKATLFTSNHFGHVALGNPTPCAVDTIRAYLATGSLPPAGASCP